MVGLHSFITPFGGRDVCTRVWQPSADGLVSRLIDLRLPCLAPSALNKIFGAGPPILPRSSSLALRTVTVVRTREKCVPVPGKPRSSRVRGTSIIKTHFTPYMYGNNLLCAFVDPEKGLREWKRFATLEGERISRAIC